MQLDKRAPPYLEPLLEINSARRMNDLVNRVHDVIEHRVAAGGSASMSISAKKKCDAVWGRDEFSGSTVYVPAADARASLTARMRAFRVFACRTWVVRTE